MMFSCCHPALTEDTQTALILRLVCGFGTNEVARAFFSEPSAMEKRLVRAKKVLADEGRLFEPTTHAEARVLGAQAGLEEILALDGRERLDAYPFYWAALGDLALRQGERTKASAWLARGLACARTETERELFLRRIGECRGVRS
jgi:predicted RNA polymerase sigma factor